MISSQKILSLTIMVYLMSGIAIGAEQFIDTMTTMEERMDDITELIDTESNQYTSEEGVWGSIKSKASQVYESTIGNVITWGKGLLNILKIGLNPFAIDTSRYTNELEKILGKGVNVIRSGMIAIMLLEIYLIFKNKKAT